MLIAQSVRFNYLLIKIIACFNVLTINVTAIKIFTGITFSLMGIAFNTRYLDVYMYFVFVNYCEKNTHVLITLEFFSAN